jgi:hypothetical protein
MGDAFPGLNDEETFLASFKYDFSRVTGENCSVKSNAKAKFTASICLPLFTNTSITPEESMCIRGKMKKKNSGK